jgi:acyl-CoA synthetase (NDP forming)
MKALWQPRGVAVVGASATPGSLGQRLLGYLREHGYAGGVYPVNPRYPEVDGLTCYPSVGAIPGPVDLVLALVGAERVMGALQDCAAKRVAYVVVHASGFGEMGARGVALEQEMAAYARANGMRIIGPNCIGLVSPADHLVAGFSPLFSRVRFEPGKLGMVTQSGALGYGIVSLAVERGLRFSRIVNTGNEADLCTAELVEELLNDDVTSTIMVYSEGVKRATDWRTLGSLSKQRAKPVIVLKSGRSEAGSLAAASHTASLAGDDTVWDAAFRQLGMLRVDDVDDMLDLAAIFQQPRLPAGPGVGVMTTSGGAGILAVDSLSAAGLGVPAFGERTRQEIQAIFPAFGTIANPLDLTGQILSDPTLFRTALRSMARDPALDALLVCFCVLQGADVDRPVDDLLTVLAETNKPILVSRTGGEFLAPGAAARLQQAGVPVFPSPARAVRAIAALVRFAQRNTGTRVAPLPAPGPAPVGWPRPGQTLTEREAKSLLAAVGLPVTREVLVTSPAEAAAVAEQMGYPLVLKIDSPDIPHKTEAGGLRLGLGNSTAVQHAFKDVMTSVRTFKPDAKLNGCLVQEQVEGAVAEILVGVSPSPMGPVVTVGLGGIFVEVFKDVSQRLAPLTADDARAMVAELRGFKLLTGIRGQKPADVEALAELVAQISRLAVQWPGQWELDLNPVMVMPAGQGCRIADALLIVSP